MPNGQEVKWREMVAGDIDTVHSVSKIIHINYPEKKEVFAERLSLYKKGCYVLASRDVIIGYAFSHPWMFGDLPKLDSLLENLPTAPDTYYIHDIAILPEHRGGGAASAIVSKLTEIAAEDNLPRISLVAVNDSEAFWSRRNFTAVRDNEKITAKLQTYDDRAIYMSKSLR